MMMLALVLIWTLRIVYFWLCW